MFSSKTHFNETVGEMHENAGETKREASSSKI